jgi:hypothetical protein
MNDRVCIVLRAAQTFVSSQLKGLYLKCLFLSQIKSGPVLNCYNFRPLVIVTLVLLFS